MVRGIDVSHHNGTIDWQKLKSQGISYVIMKVFQSVKDPMFETYYVGAHAAGFTTDVYDYRVGITEFAEAAQKVVSLIKSKSIGYVWLDLEDATVKGKGQALITQVLAYKSVIEAAGYKFGIYCSQLSFYKPYILPYLSQLADVPMWIAKYPSKAHCDLSYSPTSASVAAIKNLYAWQYASTCVIDGIEKKYNDVNYIYGVSASEPHTDIKYIVGKTYTLHGNMHVRKTAGGEILPYSALTINAKLHAKRQSDGTAVLKSGTKVTCESVQTNIADNSIWIKIPSGWVCAVMNGTTYIS